MPSPGDRFPGKLHHEKQSGEKVENQVEDIKRTDQFSTQQHPDLFNGMRFRYERSKAEENRGTNEQRSGKRVKPSHG